MKNQIEGVLVLEGNTKNNKDNERGSEYKRRRRLFSE